MMNEIECPYCKVFCEALDEGCNQDEQREMECIACKNTFVFVTNYWPSYSSSKAPCLNGEPHKWEKICGHPEEFFKNQRRCQYCNEEKTIEGKKE